jgi:hypothetical protein
LYCSAKNLKSKLKGWPRRVLKKKATDKEGDRDDYPNCKEMLSYVILGKFTQEIKKSGWKSCVANKKERKLEKDKIKKVQLDSGLLSKKDLLGSK